MTASRAAGGTGRWDDIRAEHVRCRRAMLRRGLAALRADLEVAARERAIARRRALGVCDDGVPSADAHGRLPAVVAASARVAHARCRSGLLAVGAPADVSPPAMVGPQPFREAEPWRVEDALLGLAVAAAPAGLLRILGEADGLLLVGGGVLALLPAVGATLVRRRARRASRRRAWLLGELAAAGEREDHALARALAGVEEAAVREDPRRRWLAMPIGAGGS